MRLLFPHATKFCTIRIVPFRELGLVVVEMCQKQPRQRVSAILETPACAN